MPQLNLAGVKFKTDGINVTATSGGASGQVLYTCPNNFSAAVRFLHISSGTSANKKITVEYYNAERLQYEPILNSYAMGASASFNLVNGGFFYLHSGDKVVCSTDTSGNFDVMISVEEFFDPQYKT
jgi:hypothetical protein